MAHDLQIHCGTASMMYVGDPPWHGLGQKLDEPATSAEAIEAAHLDWRVVKQPLFAGDGQTYQRVPDQYATVREDWWGREDAPILGIVGRNYTPLQNHEAFAFFDEIVGEGAAIYHTAGALGNGKRVWVLAKLPESIRVVGDDVTDKFLLLSNSHDGSSAVQVKFTPIRVVCQNTLTMALSQGPTIRVPHLARMKDRLQRVESMLGIINRRYDRITDTFQRMAQVSLNAKDVARYLEDVFPDPPQPQAANEQAAYERRLVKVRDNRLLAELLFDEGQGNRLPGIGGTLWALYNGVTELIDHRKRPSQTDERWLDSMWFGDGYRVKARAFDVAKKWLQGA